jgi:CDP-diacylglycerol--glycerol-3-phosphate 3-phosphatidyltransferase
MSSFFPEWLKNGFIKLLNPITGIFVKFNLHPNTFTVWGLIITLISIIFFIRGDLILAGILILIGGICDIIDGKVARESGQVSRFGALFDSSIDRYSEVFMFFGVATFFVRADDYLTSVVVFIALGGSTMVSYVRARAEGLGFECKVGLFQRPERIVFLGIGSIIGVFALKIAIWIVAIMANITAIHRIIYIYKLDQKKKRMKEL